MYSSSGCDIENTEVYFGVNYIKKTVTDEHRSAEQLHHRQTMWPVLYLKMILKMLTQ